MITTKTKNTPTTITRNPKKSPHGTGAARRPTLHTLGPPQGALLAPAAIALKKRAVQLPFPSLPVFACIASARAAHPSAARDETAIIIITHQKKEKA